MHDDSQLLRRYIEDRSETAFTELVHRHVHLVYFAALRRVGGDAQLADDITQRVFTDLARKAASLKNRQRLTGWLYTSTRFAAAQAVRSEQRRKTHEKKEHVMQELFPTQDPQPDWDQLRPLIDEALDELNEREREAVLLRYFEGLPFAEVAARFSLSPDAARMRVDRALEKLRAALGRRGIISTSVALSAVFAAQTAIAVPTGLVQKIAGIALSQTLPAASTTIALWKIVSGITVASIGIVVISLGIKQLREHAPTPPPAAIVSPVSTNATAQDRSSTPNGSFTRRAPLPSAATGGAAQPSHSAHRSTDDFGWPRVGLFAADAGDKSHHTVAEFRVKMKTDPEFRDIVVKQARENLDLFYSRLFRSLQLPPEQLDVFKNLLVEKERLHLDVIEAQGVGTVPAKKQRELIRAEADQSQQSLDAEIKSTLGDSNFATYLQYRTDLVQWTVIEAVTRKLAGTSAPLTDHQTNQLLILLRGALLRIQAPYTFNIAYGAGVFPPHIGAGLTPQVLTKAADFLSRAQLEALRELKKPAASGNVSAMQ